MALQARRPVVGNMLAKADASDHMITGMVKFSGWYNPSATFFALLPLLDRMERWEDLEITFSEKHSVTSMLENEFGLSDEGDAWATGMHLGPREIDRVAQA